MYLETILILSETNPHVRSIDVAEHMGFSKPSVSRAVGKLKADEYINVDEFGYLTLTEKGARVANTMYERHQFLSSFFEHIGVDHETAVDDACKIEHYISAETFDALKTHIKKAFGE